MKNVIKTVILLSAFIVTAYLVKYMILNMGYKPVNKRKHKDIDDTKDHRVEQAETVDIVYGQVSVILFYTIILIGISICLIQNGIQPTTVFAMLGTLGLTVGLSLQNTVSTIWDGLGLLINDIYRIGDIIEFKLPGVNYIISGKVVSFNLFHTKLTDTTNGSEINISNSSLKNGIITNKSVIYKQ